MLETRFEQFDMFDPLPKSEQGQMSEHEEGAKHPFEMVYDKLLDEYYDMPEKDLQYDKAKLFVMGVKEELSKVLDANFTAQHRALDKAASKVHDESGLPDFFDQVNKIVQQLPELERLQEKGYVKKLH